MEIFVTSVLSALPVYTMASFKLPKNNINIMTQLLANFWWGKIDESKKMNWLSWERLCEPKEEGGLGFKDFHAFNQAFLARQAWRILQEPDGLYARVVKGRYFPKTSFLRAVQGSNSSWGWRSVLHGRELLIKGIRWQVGTGRLINPILDLWVPNLPNFLSILSISDPVTSIPMSFSGLILRGRWNLELLSHLFNNLTIQKILTMPLPVETIKDKLIWHFAPSGAFTVHSGYEVARGKFHSAPIFRPTSLYDEPFRNKVWSLPVQPKLKIFLWKIFRGILPTRENIAKRFPINSECPVCLEEVESSEHLFMRCILAKKLAFLLNIQTQTFYHDSVAYVWRSLFTMNQHVQVIVLTFWWRLWKSRNHTYFNKAQPVPLILCFQFHYELQELQEYMEKAQIPKVMNLGPKSLQYRSISPSFPPCFSSQVDGAVSNEIGGAIGFIIRDPLGRVVFAGGKSFQAITGPFTMECLAVREALVWCFQMRVLDILIEGDGEGVQRKVLDYKTLHLVAGAIIQEIRIISKKFRRFEFYSIPRLRHQMAHNVAKFALNFLPRSSNLVNLSLFVACNVG
ncbi:Uncharacterized mitochondrial protein AtMg00310 [Linum perenne]